MNVVKMTGPIFMRKKDFLFDNVSKGKARIEIGTFDALDALGSKLAKAVMKSFNEGTPVKGIYFYGHVGNLKEVILESFLTSLENGEDLFINWSEQKLPTRFNCSPSVIMLKTLDYRRKMDVLPKADENEITVVRWTNEILEDSLEKDRIEIEIFQSEDSESVKTQKYSFFAGKSKKEMIQTATLIGFGNGTAVVESIKA